MEIDGGRTLISMMIGCLELRIDRTWTQLAVQTWSMQFSHR